MTTMGIGLSLSVIATVFNRQRCRLNFQARQKISENESHVTRACAGERGKFREYIIS